MPATHAAVSRALRHATDLAPGLDGAARWSTSGAGTGAATWAAAEAFPALGRGDGARRVRRRPGAGGRIAAAGPAVVAAATWTAPGARPDTVLPQADLAVVSYLLGELPDASMHHSSTRRWRRPARARRRARDPARLPRGPRGPGPAHRRRVAPPGPVPAGRTVPPGRRGTTGATSRCASSARPCTAGSRAGGSGTRTRSSPTPSPPVARRSPALGRVLRHPLTRKGLVQLEVCRSDGTAERTVVTRRDPMAYRAARDAAWGDAWQQGTPVIASKRTIPSIKE